MITTGIRRTMYHGTRGNSGKYMIICGDQGGRNLGDDPDWETFLSQDYGKSWTGILSDIRIRISVMSSSGKYMMCADGYTNVYQSFNFGSTWSRISAVDNFVDQNGTKYNVSDICMRSDGKMQIIIGYQYTIPYNYITYDGTTYTHVHSTKDGDPSIGFCLFSYDYGHTWSQNNNFMGIGAKVLSMSKNGKYLMCCDPNTYVSSDYGNTWTKITDIPACKSIFISDTGKIQECFNDDIYYRSDDYGSTWNTVTNTNCVRKAIGIGNGKIQYGLTGRDSIVLSKDYGLTWETVESILTPWASECLLISRNGRHSVYVGCEAKNSTTDHIYCTNDYFKTTQAISQFDSMLATYEMPIKDERRIAEMFGFSTNS